MWCLSPKEFEVLFRQHEGHLYTLGSSLHVWTCLMACTMLLSLPDAHQAHHIKTHADLFLKLSRCGEMDNIHIHTVLYSVDHYVISMKHHGHALGERICFWHKKLLCERSLSFGKSVNRNYEWAIIRICVSIQMFLFELWGSNRKKLIGTAEVCCLHWLTLCLHSFGCTLVVQWKNFACHLSPGFDSRQMQLSLFCVMY